MTGDLYLTTIRTSNGQEVIINAGESVSYATGQTSEWLYVNAEGGLEVNSSPDNWASGWAGRKTTQVKGDSITVDGNLVGHTGLGAGAVGTYAFARRPGSTSPQSPFNFGSTYAGSDLRPAGLSTNVGGTESNPYFSDASHVYIGQNNDGALSGTWRAMCQTDTSTAGDENPVGVFLRIS